MFMTLLNLAAWLFVIALGIIAGGAILYGAWRMFREVLEAIIEIPTQWRSRHTRQSWAKERKAYERAFRKR